jgi:phosphoserine phosphatase
MLEVRKGGAMPRTRATREYLVASDFDQTLSFNDSGNVLGELLGAHGFEEKVKGLARINLVQQGGELAYLLLHDPEYRKVRREHLVEVGRRIRLKPNIGRLVEILERGIDGHRFSFYVVSAAPEEVVQSALAGLVPAERIRGTRFEYDEATGEIRRVERVCAGYGKVAALAELQEQLGVSPDHVVTRSACSCRCSRTSSARTRSRCARSSSATACRSTAGTR